MYSPKVEVSCYALLIFSISLITDLLQIIPKNILKQGCSLCIIVLRCLSNLQLYYIVALRGMLETWLVPANTVFARISHSVSLGEGSCLVVLMLNFHSSVVPRSGMGVIAQLISYTNCKCYLSVALVIIGIKKSGGIK